MERRTLTIKGVAVEVSAHPFLLNFHYTAITKPIAIVDAEAAFKPTKGPVKRPLQPAAEDLVLKKPEPFPLLVEPKITETPEEMRSRLLSRFQMPACLLAQVAVPDLPPQPEPQQPILPVVDLSTPDKFVQILDCLNNLQAFNRLQAEYLARHGLGKYLEDLSKLSVWDKGYPRSYQRYSSRSRPGSNGAGLVRRKPKGHWSGCNVEELLKSLETYRPPCYTGGFRLVKQTRAVSSRDLSLKEYQIDRIPLPTEPEEVSISA